MASWGLAAFTGRKMWEESRKTQEENERLLAGRKLFDIGMEEAEKDAELTAQAAKESRRVQTLVNSKKSAIQAGGPRGIKALTEVLSGISGGDGTTWQAKDGIIYELDRDGNPIRTMDLRKASGIAMLSLAQQFVPDAATAAATYQAKEEKNQEAFREMQMKMMELDNQIRVALTNGASSAEVARLRGEYDLVEQQLRNQSALDVKKLDVDSAFRVAQVGLQNTNLKQWGDLEAVRKDARQRVADKMIPGATTQYDTSGNFTGLSVINPSTNTVIPIELTPEMASGFNDQVNQLIQEAVGIGASTGFSAPLAAYLSSADSGMTERREAQVAAATAAARQGLDAYGNAPADYASGLGRVAIPSYSVPLPTSVQPIPTVSGVINPTTGLPAFQEITQGVRQGVLQNFADNLRPTVVDPMNVYSFGYSGMYR